MKGSKTMKVILNLYLRFMSVFLVIFAIVVFLNTFLPILFDGNPVNSNSLEVYDFTKLGSGLISNLFVMIYTSVIIFAIKCTATYFDLLLLFSATRQSIMRTFNTMNIVLTLVGTAALNLLLLAGNIPNRIMFLFLITVSLYFMVNFMNFIGFVGKLFGWYFVVGSFILLAALIISTVNFIGGFIMMQLFSLEIILFIAVAAFVFFFVNQYLAKRYEYKL